MRDSYHYQERAAIAQFHGDSDRDESEALAEYCVSQCDRSESPEAWDAANRTWRRAVNKTHGKDKMDECHAALKKKHGADSFNDLRIAQIEASTDRMRSK